MSNLRVKTMINCIGFNGREKFENELNEYLKSTDKEVVDIKISYDDNYIFTMVIEKEEN